MLCTFNGNFCRWYPVYKTSTTISIVYVISEIIMKYKIIWQHCICMTWQHRTHVMIFCFSAWTYISVGSSRARCRATVWRHTSRVGRSGQHGTLVQGQRRNTSLQVSYHVVLVYLSTGKLSCIFSVPLYHVVLVYLSTGKLSCSFGVPFYRDYHEWSDLISRQYVIKKHE